MRKYTVSILHPAPAMTEDFVDFTGTYIQAVEFAQALWDQHRRTVCLRSGGDRAGYWWHRIANGVATDRNFNSGVPAETAL